MKQCSKCHKTKPLSEFHKNRTKPSGVKLNCKQCSTAYSRALYKSNPQPQKTFVNNWKKSKRAWFREYKSTLKCTQCGENHPATLDFHHVGEKTGWISNIVTAWSKENIMKEIEKCIVLCANCHRKKHYAHTRP